MWCSWFLNSGDIFRRQQAWLDSPWAGGKWFRIRKILTWLERSVQGSTKSFFWGVQYLEVLQALFSFSQKSILAFSEVLLICDQPFSLLKPSKVGKCREGHTVAVLLLEAHLRALYLFCENLLYRGEFVKFWRGPKAERASGKSPAKALCVCLCLGHNWNW